MPQFDELAGRTKKKGLGISDQDPADKYDKMEKKMRRLEEKNKEEMEYDVDQRRGQRMRGQNPVWDDEKKRVEEWQEKQNEWATQRDAEGRQRSAKGRASKGAPSFSNRMSMAGTPVREDQAWMANEAFKSARKFKPIKYPSETPEDYFKRLDEWKQYVRDEVTVSWGLDANVADYIFDDLDPNNQDSPTMVRY
jgi:hypothetical protein